MHIVCRKWGCIYINQHAHFGKFMQDYRKGSINSAMDVNREEEGAPI